MAWQYGQPWLDWVLQSGSLIEPRSVPGISVRAYFMKNLNDSRSDLD